MKVQVEGPEYSRLPTPTVHPSSGVSVRTVGIARESASVLFDAGGEAELVFGPAPYGSMWLIQSVTVVTDSALVTEARVYVGQRADVNLADATGAGNMAISDRAQPILVPGGSVCRIVWTGGAAGDRATAVIQYATAQIVEG